jgi:uncharacterized membrane protein
MKEATAFATTVIIGALAALFVWKGESGFAMTCIVALLPAAGGSAAIAAGKLAPSAADPTATMTTTKVEVKP